MTPDKARRNSKNDKNQAGCLSVLFFGWLHSLILTGWKRELTQDDVYPCVYSDRCAVVTQKLQNQWFDHLRYCEKYKKKPSFRWVLMRTFGPKFLFYGMFSLFEECGIRMIQAISFGYFIKYFSENPEDAKMYPETMGWISCIGIIVCSVCFIISFHWSTFNSHHICTHMRIAIMEMIYRKTLTLSEGTLRTLSVGQLVTLLSSDVHKFDATELHLNHLWVAPAQFFVAIYVLYVYYDFGISSLGGLFLLVMFVFGQYLMGFKITNVRNTKIDYTNRRMRFISEIMSAFYQIKAFAWETFFYARSKHSRKDELLQVRKIMFLRILNSMLSMALTKITVFLSVLFVVYFDNKKLDAQRVFITILLYDHVRMNMAYLFTYGTIDFAEISVTAKRITELLLLEEKYNAPQFYEQLPTNTKPERVCFENVSCRWHYDQTSLTLEDINLTVYQGQMVVVAGPSGAGKTSLLSAILGELPIVSGKVTVCGDIAYVPAKPWLFPGTVKQNILFGKPYDPVWYARTLDLCCLKADLDSFELGEDTKIFRAGLSAGQRARISLARAVYANASVYLMDEPLYTLDPRIQKHIVDKCIRGALKNKAIILVTHQIHFLQESDKVVLFAGGMIKAQGAYNQLLEMGVSFHRQESDDEEEIDEATMEELSKGEEEGEIVDNRKSRRSLKIEEDQNHHLIVKEDIIPDDGSVKPAKLEETRLFYRSELVEDNDNSITPEKIGFKLFWKYLRAGSSFYMVFALIILIIANQTVNTFSDIWLEHWTLWEEQTESNDKIHGRPIYDQEYITKTRNHYIMIYCWSVPTLLLLSVLKSIVTFHVCIRSSMKVFCQLLHSLLRASSQFYESTGVGQGINRFSKDMIIVDELLPKSFYEITGLVLEIIGIIIILAIEQIYTLVPSTIITLFGLFLYKMYHRSACPLKRMEANARSPIYALTTRTLEGVSTIRAFNQEKIFLKIFEDLHDNHTGTWYLYLSIFGWLGMCMNLLAISLVSACCLLFMFGERQDLPLHDTEVGITVAKAIELSVLLLVLVPELGDAETEMISIERILEFTREEGEKPWDIPDNCPPDYWPSDGNIRFKDVTVRGLGNKLLLNNLNFEIEGGTKIGIVGRSGSGKTTLINTLFRILEPCEGEIIIDDVNVLNIGLHDLRRKISLLPQAPHIFSGTVRMNVDPMDEFHDHDIWATLKDIGLFEPVKNASDGLDTNIVELGWKYRTDQAQLLALARAILSKNKILVLDEATAHLDPDMERLILRKIRDHMFDATVITVSHRISSVINSKYIVVLENGEIADFGEPFELLEQQGAFYKLVQHLGKKRAGEIYEKAKDIHIRRRHIGGAFKYRASLQSASLRSLSRFN